MFRIPVKTRSARARKFPQTIALKITHCRYNSFWFLVLRALIYNSNTKKKMQKISYMLMKKKSIRSPPPYPLRLLAQDRRPRPE